jgi:hypothetical protein
MEQIKELRQQMQVLFVQKCCYLSYVSDHVQCASFCHAYSSTTNSSPELQLICYCLLDLFPMYVHSKRIEQSDDRLFSLKNSRKYIYVTMYNCTLDMCARYVRQV